MKIQARAAVEVFAGTTALFAVMYLVGVGLEALMQAFGIQGVLTLIGVIVLGLFMNLIYQIRVSQLEYVEKLKETVANNKVDQ